MRRGSSRPEKEMYVYGTKREERGKKRKKSEENGTTISTKKEGEIINKHINLKETKMRARRNSE